MFTGSIKKPLVLICLAYFVIAFGVFAPVLNNTFLSDDYLSLYRILIQKKFLLEEFFRPLMDVSFYFNHLLSGLNPISYYLVNILIHIITSCLVLLLSFRLAKFDAPGDRLFFSALAGFLFLIYPFHVESIAWLTGRLSSIAGLCGVAILLLTVNHKNPRRTFFLSLVFFLVALCGYESIILMPLIVLAWSHSTGPSDGRPLVYFIAWCIITAGYILFRFFYLGELSNEYIHRLFSERSFIDYVLGPAKTVARLILPPIEQAPAMTGLALLSLGLAVWIHFRCIRRLSGKRKIRYYLVLWGLFISLILPVRFGLSTRTSEGDRLLYFPSAFLCILLSYWIMTVSRKPARKYVVIAVTGYFSFFLYKSIAQWDLASKATEAIRTAVSSPGDTTKAIINIPDELDGAYVFRHGFNEFLTLYGIDVQRVVPVNYLDRLEYLHIPGVIVPAHVGDTTFIYPEVKIVPAGPGWFIVRAKQADPMRLGPRAVCYYWNKKELIRLPLSY